MADIAYLANIDLNYNELKKFKFENLSSDPTGNDLVAGRMWVNTSESPNVLKYYDGTSTITVGQLNYGASNPLMNGTATPGTANAVSRADHVHPSDTTKVTANNAITGATKCKITYDSKGLVTGGENLVASDIPDLGSEYIKVSQKGVANGVATLGADGYIPSTQLPSYVDDVIDAYIVSGATALSAGWLSESSGGSALTPEIGKIYVIVSTGDYQHRTFRWTGTTYAELKDSVIYTAGNGIEESAAHVFSLDLDSTNANGLAVTSDGLKLNTASTSANGAMTSTMVTKLNGIATGATKVEASNTNGNIKINGTETTVYTPNAAAAAVFSTTNGALTPTNNVCTWTVTHNLGENVVVSVYRVSDKQQVMCNIAATSSTQCTVLINSSGNISAGTYKVVVIGIPTA